MFKLNSLQIYEISMLRYYTIGAIVISNYSMEFENNNACSSPQFLGINLQKRIYPPTDGVGTFERENSNLYHI